MCNANNHPPNCRCGWGEGSNYSYSTIARNRYAQQENPSSYTDENYTTPNARCRVCGQNVFYYQSSTGSKVFFDELGPPWTKHPCTDNPYQTSHIIKEIENNSSSTIYKWQENNWSPFLAESIDYLKIKNLIKFRGTLNKEYITIYVKSSLKLVCDTPFQIKSIGFSKFKLSTFQFDSVESTINSVYLTAYLHMQEAHKSKENKGRVFTVLKNLKKKIKKSKVIQIKKPKLPIFLLQMIV